MQGGNLGLVGPAAQRPPSPPGSPPANDAPRGANGAGACIANQAPLAASDSLLIGESPALASIKDVARSVATRRSTVMVLGETGTGKEMLARHVHICSDRAARPFIPVDCSAITETLFESQLFGHTKGAFTGAVRDSLGFIRAADGGTLFLDEIGELPLALQAKLLRVLQERAVVPVGDTQAYPVDVRIVCATHRDLRQMVRDGTFREDLFFRLNVIVMEMPPLRERPQDVVPLARHFLRTQSELYDEPTPPLSDAAIAALLAYPWPGNVRELSNAIEHAYVLANGPVIELQDLPDRIRRHLRGDASAGAGSELCLEDVERQTIAEALRRTKGNKTQACRLLGINVQRLNRRIDKLGIRSGKR